MICEKSARTRLRRGVRWQAERDAALEPDSPDKNERPLGEVYSQSGVSATAPALNRG
jgi:hypothetical protein